MRMHQRKSESLKEFIPIANQIMIRMAIILLIFTILVLGDNGSTRQIQNKHIVISDNREFVCNFKIKL